MNVEEISGFDEGKIIICDFIRNGNPNNRITLTLNSIPVAKVELDSMVTVSDLITREFSFCAELERKIIVLSVLLKMNGSRVSPILPSFTNLLENAYLYFQKHFGNIQGIKSEWSEFFAGQVNTNFEVFWKNMSENNSSTLSAAKAPTGKACAKIGFDKVNVQVCNKDYVRVIYTK